MNDLFEDKNALMSKDKTHRFVLWRIWDDELPKVAFIGLNPSTADAITDDPTIRRVRRFAKDWGYGGFYMLNLFTKITPYPKELARNGNLNMTSEYWLRHYIAKSKEVVFAWGSNKLVKKRAANIAKMYPHASALDINKNGSPKHPLYVKADIKRITFKQ